MRNINYGSAKKTNHALMNHVIKRILEILTAVLIIILTGSFVSAGTSFATTLKTDISKTNAKTIKAGTSNIKKPLSGEKTKPFLQIKKAYVFPKDNKLKIVIQNTGGGILTSKEYLHGKLEITVLGTSTKWWWPLIKLKQKNDHFISETTFNTNKILTETKRIMVRIKGVKAGKPWIGNLIVDNKTKKKAPRPPKAKTPESVKKLVAVKNKNTKMVTRSIEMTLDRDSQPLYYLDNPISGSRINRSSPYNIVWWLPDDLVSDDGQPEARFEVELLKNEQAVARIDSMSYTYDSSSNLCALPWSISQDIQNGRDYKIRVTAYPINQHEHSGNYKFVMRGPFAITGEIFQIFSPASGTTIDRNTPPDISWSLPSIFHPEGSQPAVTFKVELLKNGRVAAQINSMRYSYNSSSNRCTLPWLVSPEIMDGWGYKIKVTIQSLNQYDHQGNYTATLPNEFRIVSGSEYGSPQGIAIYDPRYRAGYKVGDRMKISYGWGGQSGHSGDYKPQTVKIKLAGASTGTRSNVMEWVQTVPEPERTEEEERYYHTITIPVKTNNLNTSRELNLNPGAYVIRIHDANPSFAHLIKGTSAQFFITHDETSPPDVQGVSDGVINESFGIISTGNHFDAWLLENEQLIEWKFDPDLGDIEWSVSIDMISGSGHYTVLPSTIETSQGKGTARFTLPRNFRLSTGTRPQQYAEIKVIGKIRHGHWVTDTRTVTINKTIEMLFPDDNFSPGYGFPIDFVQRIRFFIARSSFGRVGIALKKGMRIVKIINVSMAASQGENEFDWRVFHDLSREERTELIGNDPTGFRIRVYSIQNPDVYDESAPFAITQQ